MVCTAGNPLVYFACLNLEEDYPTPRPISAHTGLSQSIRYWLIAAWPSSLQRLMTLVVNTAHDLCPRRLRLDEPRSVDIGADGQSVVSFLLKQRERCVCSC